MGDETPGRNSTLIKNEIVRLPASMICSFRMANSYFKFLSKVVDAQNYM